MSPAELDPTHWRLVYDVRQTFPWLDLLVIAGVGLIVLGWVRLREAGGLEAIAEGWDRQWVRSIGTMAVGAYLTLIFTFRILIGDLNLRSDVKSGRCQLLEGLVTDFQTGGTAGHGVEAFRLETPEGQYSFRYGPMDLEPGYGRLSSQGGVIVGGVRVRLCVRGGDIGRVEIAE